MSSMFSGVSWLKNWCRWDGAIGIASVILVGMVAGLTVGASGCTDTMEAKQGALGEFCNGADVECRSGMVCSDNVCIRQNRSGAACRTVCDTFERCQVGESNCFSNCAASLSNWRREAVRAYAGCYEDVEESECELVRDFGDGAQNYCVSEIPQLETRLPTCSDLETKGRTCLSNTPGVTVGEYSQQFTQLDGECRLAAKTYSLDAWNDFLGSGCQAALSGEGNDECGQLFRCVNEEFDIGRTEAEADPQQGEEPFPPFPTSRPATDDSDESGE